MFSSASPSPSIDPAPRGRRTWKAPAFRGVPLIRSFGADAALGARTEPSIPPLSIVNDKSDVGGDSDSNKGGFSGKSGSGQDFDGKHFN
jgi:hypothetical protein